jgi:hypothetical protein
LIESITNLDKNKIRREIRKQANIVTKIWWKFYCFRFDAKFHGPKYIDRVEYIADKLYKLANKITKEDLLLIEKGIYPYWANS